MRCLHIIEYQSVIKRNKLLIHATRMNLKSIMRSKRSWLQKTNIKILEKPKVSIVTENKLLITRSQDMHGTMILIERGHEGSFLWWKSSIIWFHWWLDDYPGSLKFMILCISNSLVSFSVNYISMKLITFLNCFLECLPQEMMLTITRKKYSKFLFNYVPEKFVFIALPDTWLENSKYSSGQKVIHQHQNFIWQSHLVFWLHFKLCHTHKVSISFH